MSRARLLWRSAAERLPKSVITPLRACKRLLVDDGFMRTVRARKVVDRDGRPIPWMTYPAIAYLTNLDLSDSSVFEWGSGHSTLFWQERARSVLSVENDPEWARWMCERLDGARARCVTATSRDEYVAAIDAESGPYDLIVVDGSWRGACAEAAPPRLADGGMIIVDNSDWVPDVCAGLRAEGFRQVDMSGSGPINFYHWTTSFFFRNGPGPRPIGPQPAPPPGGIAADDALRARLLSAMTPDGSPGAD